jgi:peroxiredoxin
MPASDPFELPEDLPVPEDDGAGRHLEGARLPSVSLPSTTGGPVDLSKIAGTIVVYCYPRTGRPGQALPVGWDEIPGARGCTPQACAFRDYYQEIRVHAAEVFGLSTQSTDYQKEMVSRLHVPFPVLSDENLAFASALRLPTLTVEAMTLIKRLTLIATDGTIEKVFYPVFPPHKNPDDVIAWLQANG